MMMATCRGGSKPESGDVLGDPIGAVVDTAVVAAAALGIKVSDLVVRALKPS
jgi:hypothetical protein